MSIAGAAKAKKKFTHPARRGAKVAVRRHVLEAIGPRAARVFDAFAGPGGMFHAVWREAAVYVGCDLRWYRDERRVYVADNRVVLRAIDLAPFTIFDLDAFGSPWEHVEILAARRRLAPGAQLGLVVTDGSGLKLRCGALPHALARLADAPTRLPLANRLHGELAERALRRAADRMGGTVTRLWQAASERQAAMRYYGAVLSGPPAG